MNRLIYILGIIGLLAVMTGCTSEKETEVTSNEVATTETTTEEPIVNIYTDRHYDTDQALYDTFTAATGITVNVVKAESDEILERLALEGEGTEADLLITSDVGRLVRASERDLLQAYTSDVINTNIPENYRDQEQNWVALTMRARIIAYNLEKVDPSQLSTYEALTQPEWQGRVLVRSSSNIYNQSLLASFIAIKGEEEAETWAAGLLANMARTPEGNDRDQMKAVVAGEGDVAIVNTYYLGKLLNSSDPVEVEVGQKVGVFFPNQETEGTHINISGGGLTKYAKHPKAATQLLEFLTGEQAQYDYANANYEYPVNPKVEPSDFLKSWGDFKVQDIDLELLGTYNDEAVMIFNKVGWQ